ncbi:hypothetical protein [Actinoplanes sp. URMC 104]|uniref:hypothetical protein n=1 Tax=Actinoplanes sp. URMC 104 TaxID=3423409 RepID=UPI003F1D3CB5
MRKHIARSLAGGAGAAAVAAGLALALPAQASAHHPPKPTIVLVHGAWATSSSWDGVIERLHKAGYSVRAASTPQRGVASDAAAVKSLVDSIGGRSCWSDTRTAAR